MIFKSFTPLVPSIILLLFLAVVGGIYEFFLIPAEETIFHFFAYTEFFFFSFISLFLGFLFFWKEEKGKKLFYCTFFIVIIYTSICLFGAQKSIISYIVPYQWDYLFAKMDKIIHFGKYPHEWLGGEKISPLFVSLIDVLYFLWFFVIYIWMSINLIIKSNIIQLQKIIISFCLVWILLGNIAATYFSSCGPIFWEYCYGTINPYSDYIYHINALFEEHKMFAFFFKISLLEMQNNDQFININAISAMPSLHVGMVFLIFLSIPYRHLFLKIMSGAYVLAILIGSVVLGWHYAIDGYVAIAGVFCIWHFVNYVLNLYSDRIKI